MVLVIAIVNKSLHFQNDGSKIIHIMYSPKKKVNKPHNLLSDRDMKVTIDYGFMSVLIFYEKHKFRESFSY